MQGDGHCEGNFAEESKLPFQLLLHTTAQRDTSSKGAATGKLTEGLS